MQRAYYTRLEVVLDVEVPLDGGGAHLLLAVEGTSERLEAAARLVRGQPRASAPSMGRNRGSYEYYYQ